MTTPAPVRYVHIWEFTGCHPHNGEYWYKCTNCEASDWVGNSRDSPEELCSTVPCVKKEKIKVEKPTVKPIPANVVKAREAKMEKRIELLEKAVTALLHIELHSIRSMFSAADSKELGEMFEGLERKYDFTRRRRNDL